MAKAMHDGLPDTTPDTERSTGGRRGRKQKRCKVCLEKFTPFTTLQPVCLNPTCILENHRRVKAKKAKREQQERGKVKREALNRLKTLSELCGEAQRAVNLYVRVRDFRKGCISCETGVVTDAGHLFPIGSKYRVNRIRLDPRQINGQCSKCNRFTGGGNATAHREGIVKRYGAEHLRMLDDLKRMADQGQLPPLTKDEVRSIAAEFRKRARDAGAAHAAAMCA